MSAADLDLDQLSPSERTALETYTTVTGQEPADAITLLRRSQWNVQVGAPSQLRRDSLLTPDPDSHLQVL